MGRIEFRDEIVIQDGHPLRVLDGDTIDYRDVRYRLAGYDSPERRGGSCRSVAWRRSPRSVCRGC
ncbi:MAG: hypothetical protein R3D68_17060 [Hyphomicrobiaceae bacterium]